LGKFRNNPIMLRVNFFLQASGLARQNFCARRLREFWGKAGGASKGALSAR
jgi:hypothetical protein